MLLLPSLRTQVTKAHRLGKLVFRAQSDLGADETSLPGVAATS